MQHCYAVEGSLAKKKGKSSDYLPCEPFNRYGVGEKSENASSLWRAASGSIMYSSGV